ncbi:MAG TPA: NAD(P)H-hydrate dehydratase, partial [Candidatus Limnocylindrales bacterium]|nr:NAD(P)H-hydrate dehydratase [Candidatus Limnocylindrales bacterium]
MPERRGIGFGRRQDPAVSAAGGRDEERPWPEGVPKLDEETAVALLPRRPVRGHKGSFGKLLVIAGSLDYAGAALLVSRAAGRAGVGLVTLAVPETLQPLFAAKVVEATTMALPEDDVEEIDPEPALARILDHDHDALVVGPGLRPGLATAELVRDLLDRGGEERPP